MDRDGAVKRSRLGALLATAVPVLLAVLFPLLTPIGGFAEAVTKYFSRPVKAALGTVFGLLPFSVMEAEYIAAAVLAAVWVVRTVIITARAEKRLAAFLKRLWALLLAAAYLLVFFLWCFAVDYRSLSFSERSGIEAGKVSREDLYTVTEYFVTRASELSGGVQRDGEGHWAEDMDVYIRASRGLYANIHEEFPFLSANSRVPKKMYLTSVISSHMGFTGVYFPFSGESNINIDAPGCLIPSTIAHELAHQKGVYAEQEANFVGIAASVASGDPVYMYSGFLDGAIYLSNALYSADPELWYSLTPLMSDEMRVDWNDNNAYWRAFEGKVEEVSSKVYDGYLKAQGQELGIRSYGACVDLLVAYYLPEASK